MAPSKPIVRRVDSHHQVSIPYVRLLDWSAMPHIPLPVSPARMQDGQQGKEEIAISDSFEVDNDGVRQWRTLGTEKLKNNESFPVEFRQYFTTSNGAVALDPRGASDPTSFAAAIRYDAYGNIDGRASFTHGLYRVGVSVIDGAIIGLSRSHIAHAYDSKLRLVLETDLARSPVVIGLQKELGFDADDLHLKLRTVAISDDATRYIFTLVDRAWCFDIHGKCLWALQFPVDLVRLGNVSEEEDGFIIDVDYDVTRPDWIYASAFAGTRSHAFLAGYSGKIVEVGELGVPVRFYSIGKVPTRIVAVDDRLCLLTDTRFYLLRDNELVALADSTRGGDIFVTRVGAGVLEKGRFRLFDERGAHLGTVLSKDTIRRVYQDTNELIVETRTRRLRIGGAQLC